MDGLSMFSGEAVTIYSSILRYVWYVLNYDHLQASYVRKGSSKRNSGYYYTGNTEIEFLYFLRHARCLNVLEVTKNYNSESLGYDIPSS